MPASGKSDGCAPVSGSNPPKFLHGDAAAEYVHTTWGLRCAPKWLSKMRSVGGGPKFQHFGSRRRAVAGEEYVDKC
jgi:hypothetical protein